MNKQQALEKCRSKFTNLYDGSVKSSVGIGEIIAYYESLLVNKVIVEKPVLENIERKFQEMEIQEIEDEEDRYNGNGNGENGHYGNYWF